MTEREAADRLNLMPGYVAILERDAYESLRSPTFARGYDKAYGRLLGVEEDNLLSLFDDLFAADTGKRQRRVETRPLQLQSTGKGVVIGLGVLVLLFGLLWWWQGDGESRVVSPVNAGMQVVPDVSPPVAAGGEQ